MPPEPQGGRRAGTRVGGEPVHVYAVGTPSRGDVLIIPGLCVSAYLRPAADALAAEGYRVHLVDPPGWPHSGEPVAEPASTADIAAVVVRWLERQGLVDVLVIGQSFGAQIAPHVASQAPDRVRMVVLQGPTFDPSYRTYFRALVRWLSDMPREKPSLLVVEAPEWLRVGLRRVRRMLRIALADRLEDAVPDVRCRVVVAVGEHDPLSTRPWTHGLATDASSHVVMPGLPHSSPHTDPRGFARLVSRLDTAGVT